jgi:B12 binding domain
LTLDRPALAERYLSALLERNSHHAGRVIDEALQGGVPIADIYLHVLQPALYELGRRWASGDVNVAYEHYATAVTEGLLTGLAERMEVAPVGGRLAVVACTPGEEHGLGARMVSDFLRAEGWEVASRAGPRAVHRGGRPGVGDGRRPDGADLRRKRGQGGPIALRSAPYGPRPVMHSAPQRPA